MYNWENRHEYILVLPNGDVKGFNDYEEMKGYVNIYYTNVVKAKSMETSLYDRTEEAEQITKDICIQLGVDEGECRVYNLEDFITTLQNNLVFDDEKEEIISKLLQESIELNINDYRLDEYLVNTEEVNIIEQFGEI